MAVLAGDIGGTKTTLALYDSAEDLHCARVEKTYSSGAYKSLEDVVSEFLSICNTDVRTGVFGVAGPVIAGCAQITNLPWVIEESALAVQFGFQTTRLLNDLVATANAIPVLQPNDLFELQAGRAVAESTIAVIAPGTGLGEAFLTCNEGRYIPHASEGGHADFSPSNPFELELLTYLYSIYDHVSTERVCSGMGLPNIYRFLVERHGHRFQDPQSVTDALATAADPTPIIVENALQRGQECPLCAQTLESFVAILGAEAGDLALTVMAAGGLYLGGGIPPRILPALQSEHFLRAFQKKGRFTQLMSQIPVHVILNPRAALLGAARVAFALEAA